MKAEFLPGNALELLETGRDFFPALIAAIDAAQREFHLETYIFEDDASGRAVAAALCRAAQRGVAVRVLADGFGAAHFSATLRPQLEAAGVKVLIYRPEIARFRLRRHRLRRLHRKLAVADGRCAFVGGINIVDDIDAARPAPPRFDYAVRIEGPLLAPIHASVRRLWTLVAWAGLRRRLRLPAASPVTAEPRGSTRAAFVIRDNLRHRRDIEEAYLEAIDRARGEILIANAYFLPGGRFRQALLGAAARGVRVTVLLQGRVEYALQHYATQSLYDILLRAGIRIFEYHSSFLHAKVAPLALRRVPRCVRGGCPGAARGAGAGARRADGAAHRPAPARGHAGLRRRCPLAWGARGLRRPAPRPAGLVLCPHGARRCSPGRPCAA